MRTRTKVTIAVLLLVFPVAWRWVWFNRGKYTPPTISQIDGEQIEVSPPEYSPITDEAAQGGGRVVFDLAHYNNLEVDDLTPLRDRLIARGATIRTHDGLTTSLESQLRGAIALVVAAPTFSFTGAESNAVLEFVESGGRVLLMADPTRPIPIEDEEEFLDLSDIFFPESAIPAINSLASPLGVVYFDDYVYNLVDNEGNYRNVRLSPVDGDSPLVEDLETVVFFAAHSLRSEGPSLLVGDQNTSSSLRTGEGDLAAAVLSADGRVLALGDLTSLTAPYHAVADNDRFLSNIADWLATAEREWNLTDFPYLFQRPVDLVQTSGEFLDPRLISRSGQLSDVLALADLTLELRDSADPDHDAIYVGTFDDVELVQEYLDDAGVVITLVDEEETTTTAAEEEEGEVRDNVQVEELGTVPTEGTTLFVVHRSAGRVAVVALGEDGDAAMDALDRLWAADFIGCVDSEHVTLCSTGEAEDGLGLDEEREPPEEEEEEEPTPGQPRIGSPLESEAALAEGVPWLLELAEEEYEDGSQAGETYEYTVALDPGQDALWVYGWCTATPEQLEQNWEHINLVFTMNDVEVPLSSLARLDIDTEVEPCRLYYAVVTDWPAGEHVLVTEVTFETELDDGEEIFPAGTHYYRYNVTVGG